MGSYAGATCLALSFCLISFLLGIRFERRRALTKDLKPNFSAVRSENIAEYEEVKPTSSPYSTYHLSHNSAYGEVLKSLD